MFAPRARLDENALMSQTPGPSMGRGRNDSPLKARGNMTTVGKLKQQNGQMGELGETRYRRRLPLAPAKLTDRLALGHAHLLIQDRLESSSKEHSVPQKALPLPAHPRSDLLS